MRVFNGSSKETSFDRVSRSNLSGVSTSAKHPKTMLDVKATIHCEVSLPKVVTASSRCLRLLQAVFFCMAEWGWRPKELYVFELESCPFSLWNFSFPCAWSWNDNVMTWNDNRMRCNDNGIRHCHLVASFFLCNRNSRRYLFCQERFALTNSGGVNWGGRDRDMKKIHRAMIFRILEKDPGMLMYYAAHTR